MPLNAKLVVVGGDVKTAEIKLRLPSTVGRGRGTTIMLPHPLVSRQHCELYEANGQLMVRDLGSLNGTFVNNQRITESPLPPGELLTIGTVTFRAMYDAQPDSHPPTGTTAQPKAKRNETDAATLPTPIKQPASATPGSDDFELAEAIPVDDDGGPVHATEPAPTEPGVKTTSAASAKTKPAPPKPAAPAPAPKTPAPAAKPADKTEAAVDFSKWKDDAEADEAIKTDDDDLGDFLKSLEK
jgi:predicted component of type VI protein secretion system